MPLMWAHAEYIKLLRSIRDGEIFDLIPVVAERYRRPRGEGKLEVWKPVRHVRQMKSGQMLRIQAPAPFRLHWTNDDWQVAHDSDSQHTNFGIDFVDVRVALQQRGPLRFTFFWSQEDRWEGRDFQVRIEAAGEESST